MRRDPDDNPDPDKKYDQWKDEYGPHSTPETREEQKMVSIQIEIDKLYLKLKETNNENT